MSKQEKQTILVYALHYVIYCLFTSFLNVYLFAYTNSFVIMALFVAVRMVPYTCAAILSNKLASKLSYTMLMSIGLCFIVMSLLFSIHYTYLFIQNPLYSLFVAVLCGFGFGFTWDVLNSLCQIVTPNENRSLFISSRTTFANIAGMAAPLLSTAILAFSKDDLIGYRNILIVVILFCLLVTMMCLPLNSIKSHSIPYHFQNVFHFEDTPSKSLQLSSFFYGIYDALFLTITGILLSNAAGSGTLYSSLLTVFAIISVLLCRFVPKLLARNNIKKTMIISGLFSLSATCILSLFVNLFGALYFKIISATLMNFFDQARTYVHSINISYYKDKTHELITTSSIYNAAGRILGMCFIVLCYFLLPSNLYLPISVCTCSMAVIPVLFYELKMIHNIFCKEKR